MSTESVGKTVILNPRSSIFHHAHVQFLFISKDGKDSPKRDFSFEIYIFLLPRFIDITHSSRKIVCFYSFISCVLTVCIVNDLVFNVKN